MKTRVARLLAAWPLVLLAVLVHVAPVAAGQSALPPRPLPVWSAERVDAGVSWPPYAVPALALDPAGRPHIAYGSNQLYHAWLDNGLWRAEVVDAVGSRSAPAIAIDAAGVITIVSSPNAATAVNLNVYRHAPGGSWQTAAVAGPRFPSAPWLSLALDSAAQPHLVAFGGYDGSEYSFTYAQATPAGWRSETVATGPSLTGPPDLALDSRDRPVVLYGDGGTLWLSRRDATGWTRQAVAEGDFLLDKALALDGQDRAHVVYGGRDGAPLIYRHQTATGWQDVTVAPAGISPSLALDEAGRPHVTYVFQSVTYAVLDNGTWRRTPLPHGQFGTYGSIRLDSAGAAHVVFSGYWDGDSILYATNSGGPWATTKAASRDTAGSPNALALDATGRPSLLYYRSAGRQLRWAVKDGDAWQTAPVADVAPDGLEVAAAIGPNGVAIIAYVDSEADRVMVGTRAGGQWQLAELTTAGRNLRLAIGQDNRPQLILTQGTTLLYWTRVGGQWRSETVNPTAPATGSAYLALDAQNRPHVAWDAVSGVILATRQDADDWRPETLPLEQVRGLALGPDGAPHLLTLTTVGGSKPPTLIIRLWLSEQRAGQWASELLLETSPGVFIIEPGGSLLVDEANRLHLAFYDEEFGHVSYRLRDEDGQWADSATWEAGQGPSLALTGDGEPRLSLSVNEDLILATRRVLWLDKHALLPALLR